MLGLFFVHLGLICHFAVYMRVACPAITVHIQALLAASSPSLLYACACVVYADTVNDGASGVQTRNMPRDMHFAI